MRNLNKSMRNANDERYTPPILVEPIIPFVQKDWTVWCPFDKVSFDGRTSSFNTSYFCNRLLPHDLIFTHLEHNNTGRNFVGSKIGR